MFIRNKAVKLPFLQNHTKPYLKMKKTTISKLKIKRIYATGKNASQTHQNEWKQRDKWMKTKRQINKMKEKIVSTRRRFKAATYLIFHKKAYSNKEKIWRRKRWKEKKVSIRGIVIARKMFGASVIIVKARTNEIFRLEMVSNW